MTGFRFGLQGAQGFYGIEADLTCLGKVIGGGMPVGAYGGRADVMQRVAPLGDVYQAGTLSGNPVAMAAGYATLKTYFETDAPTKIEILGQHLDTGVQGALADVEDMKYVRLGSLFWFYFDAAEPPRGAEDIPSTGSGKYAAFHRFLLKRGVYMAPSAFEVGFLNTAMTKADLDRLPRAIRHAKQEGVIQ
jgi:glutamate-1-semialdehyde 2,1-aminomutase